MRGEPPSQAASLPSTAAPTLPRGRRGKAVPLCIAAAGRQSCGESKFYIYIYTYIHIYIYSNNNKKKREMKKEREVGKGERRGRGVESWDRSGPEAPRGPKACGALRLLRACRRPPFSFLSNLKLVPFTTSPSRETKSGSARPQASWRLGICRHRATWEAHGDRALQPPKLSPPGPGGR